MPVSNMSYTMQPFFIVGTQRSGSTLLRLILNAHSRIAIPEEARFLQPLLKKSNVGRYITDEELKNLIKYLRVNPYYRLWNYDNNEVLTELSSFDKITLKELIQKLFESFAKFEGKEIWGDKSLFLSIDVLHELFPEAGFIHIIRDGRDVLDSWRRMDPRYGNAAVSALDWRLKVRIIEKAFEKLPQGQSMTLRYEDLLGGAEESIKKVCAFLKVEFELAMLGFYRTSRNYIGTHHSKLIFRPLDSKNTGKWKTRLTPLEVGAYELISGHELKRYGYETGCGRALPASAAYAAVKLAAGLPAKVAGLARVRLVFRHAVKTGSGIGSLQVGNMPEGEAKE
jgi:hypothetical protein